MKRFLLMTGLAAALPCAAMAADLTFSGLLDLRLVAPSGQESNVDGGLGKFPWGGSPVIPDLGQAVLRGSALLLPDLRAVAEIRYDPNQKTAVDLLDAYLRYRPVSTSRWRWGIRMGAFFPPVSLENTGIGWTPEWTLTPSAINDWVGEELRIIGGEATVEWRGNLDRIEFTASAFGLNQPAGEAISSHGWTFNDRPIGLFDHVRLPNALVAHGEEPWSYEFRQFDHSVGWYAGITWERPDIGRVALLHYDNEADPAANNGYTFAWRTKFWSLNGSTQLGPVVILAQAIMGSTAIEPRPSHVSTTDFWAYYVLAGIERGDWRFAVRFDQFATSETTHAPPPHGNEQGVAATTAVTWTPYKGVRIVGELIGLDYNQAQRTLIGKSPHVTEIQAQLALLLTF